MAACVLARLRVRLAGAPSDSRPCGLRPEAPRALQTQAPSMTGYKCALFATIIYYFTKALMPD